MVRLAGATFAIRAPTSPVLQDVSLTALPGTTTAIVGSTGSGKSTLVSLICRLYDVTAGAVLIDGVDVREYDTERLWSAIGLVPQRGYLFSGTIADNLRYGAAPEQVVTEEEMWEAFRVAAADGFVPRTMTDCRCASARAASTSPAGSVNGWRSPVPSSAALPSTCSRRLLRARCAHRGRVRASLREMSARFHDYRCHTTGFDGGRGRPSDRDRCRETGRSGHS